MRADIAERATGSTKCCHPRAAAAMTAQTTTKFPEIHGGGSLMLAWQARGKKVLVVGGGDVCRLGSRMAASCRVC